MQEQILKFVNTDCMLRYDLLHYDYCKIMRSVLNGRDQDYKFYSRKDD